MKIYNNRILNAYINTEPPMPKLRKYENFVFGHLKNSKIVT
jgi:hypothetical protein